MSTKLMIRQCDLCHDSRNFWACDTCEKWFHVSCVATVSSSPSIQELVEPSEWECSNCSKATPNQKRMLCLTRNISSLERDRVALQQKFANQPEALEEYIENVDWHLARLKSEYQSLAGIPIPSPDIK